MPGKLVSRIWQSDPALYAPAKHKRACRYEAFIPDGLADGLQINAMVSGIISDAEREIRELNDHGGATLAPFARLLLRTESIASSKVEGMQLGVRELARAEARVESGMSVGSTAVEVLANIEAMSLAIDDASDADAFGEEQLRAIHRRLLERTAHQSIAGKVRETQNWIGGNDYNPCGADFVPPPPEDVPRLLQDLYRAINDESLSPLVQAALVHAQFETIHPFDDGNGRTGRALIHVVLKRRGIAPRFIPPISLVFARAKDRYIAGLTRFREDGVVEWIEQFAVATVQSARIARSYLDDIRELQEGWRERLRSSGLVLRSDAAAWAIIDLLPAHPMISAPVAAATIDRARSRVYEAMSQLVEAGVLLPLSEGKRNRWWEAAGLLEVIGRVEGA